ncbi:MAG: tetratricopeptide repeat protein, partial [Terriglobales bacterium]
FERAQVYFFKEDYNRALNDCNKCFTTDGLESISNKARELRVKTYEKLKRWKEAIADLDIILKDVPKMRILSGTTKKNLIQRAEYYAKLKDYDKALTSVDFVLHIEPKRTEALLLKAHLAKDKQDYRLALNCYNQLIALDYSISGWFRERAEVYKKLGNEAAAQRDIKAATDLEKSQ